MDALEALELTLQKIVKSNGEEQKALIEEMYDLFPAAIDELNKPYVPTGHIAAEYINKMEI